MRGGDRNLDVTKAFEAGKVKPIFLSALFSKVSPTAATLDE